MKCLLPSIRYLIPVVALFLWAQVGWSQCGVSTTGTPQTTPIAAPTTIVNNVTFDDRYTNTPMAVPVGCTGCSILSEVLMDNDPCYDSDGDGDPTNDMITLDELIANGGFDLTTMMVIEDGTDATRMCPGAGPPGSGGTLAGCPGTPNAACDGDNDGDATNGNGVPDYTNPTGVNATDGDIPLANLPTSLGGVSTQFFDVDFYLDANCEAEVRLAGTGWMAATTCGCRYVNYYDQFGEFLGREDIVTGVGIAANNPVPFILDEVNKNATSSTAGYPKVGDYIFFQIDNGLACDANTANNTAACGALLRSSIFAFRIRNIFDNAPPVIKGTYNTSDDYCAPNIVTFDNAPTSIVGDPRNVRNDTELLITDNDPTAGRGGDGSYDAQIPNGSTVTPRTDKVRALLCRELLDEANDNGGVLPGDILPDPYMFNYIFNYGGTDQPNTPRLRGTGFLDGTNPSNDERGEIYTTAIYAGTTDVMQDAGMPSPAVVSTNSFQPFAPDGCGGAVTVGYSDAVDYTDRGNLYGRNSDAITGTEDVSDGVLIPIAAGFGLGGDGRFRDCYDVIRKWSATDEDGNTGMCDQTISVIDDYENEVCRTGGTPQVSQTGSPFFLTTAPTSGSDSITVFPQYFDQLMCASGASNIYQNTAGLTPAGASAPAPIPTLYSYTNPLGSTFPDVVAPNFAVGFNNQGAAGPSSTDNHYNFPVFTYAADENTYDCSQEAILDGFMPMPIDSCGIRPLVEIETLYDYGLDGDFGDIGPNIFISGSTPPPFYDKEAGIYYNNFSGGNQAQTTGDYVQYDDRENGFTPAQCQYYNYDILKRWVAEDECGFKSIAQRMYRIRDVEAPDVTMTDAIEVNGAGQILTSIRDTLISSVPGDTMNVKEFNAPAIITIPFTGCSPQLAVTTDYEDNCANVLYINTTYDIEEVNGATTTPIISGFPFTGSFTRTLEAGKTYKVILHSTDPCSNKTDVELTVITDPNGMTGCADTSPVSLTLTTGGTAQVNSLLVMPTSSCIKPALLNGCSLPDCVYLEMEVNGSVVDAGTILDVTSDADLNIIDFLDQIPTYVFNCQTGTFPVTVNLYEVTPCLPGDINTAFDASTQGRDLLITHTRDIIVNPSPSSSIFLSATGMDATSSTATDGEINLSIASSFPGETFTVNYAPVVGGVVGASVLVTTVASAPSYTITGLSAGTYQVTVTGSSSCGTAVETVTVGFSTPLQLKFLCPDPVVEGNVINVQVAPCSNFTNLNSVDFGITLSGPAGASIIDLQATNGFGSSTGGFNIGAHYSLLSSTQADIVWTSGTMENLVNNQAFITILVNVPPGSAPGTLSITLDGGLNGVSGATQNMGLTSSPVTLTFDPTTIPCNSTINPTSSVSLTASGNITFMSTGIGVSNTNVSIQNMTSGTVNNASTGVSPSTGSYSFSTIAVGDNVKITPTKTSASTATYVDVVDAIILERYASGPLLFPASTHGMIHPSQAVAGDVNFDGGIDFVDVVQIRQSIVGFPAFQYIKTDWVFYPTTTAFSAMPFYTYTAPLMQCFGGTLTASNPNIDFIGVKVGDVNETAQTAIMPGPNRVEVRGNSAFTIEDRRMEVGELVELPVYAKNFHDLFGYQTNILFDTDYLEFVDVALGTALPDMERRDFGLEAVASGIIPAIWGGLNNANLEDGDLLFTLKFRATKSANSLKGLIDFNNSERVASLAYNGALDAYALGLELTAAKASEFVLYPSAPNPFAEATKLSFELPIASDVVLSVTDLTGRVIYTTKSNMDAGYNELWLNASQLNASGVYYYQIKAGNYEVSDRVILMD